MLPHEATLQFDTMPAVLLFLHFLVLTLYPIDVASLIQKQYVQQILCFSVVLHSLLSVSIHHSELSLGDISYFHHIHHLVLYQCSHEDSGDPPKNDIPL